LTAEELRCDVLVAGGGINGAAIARDAAGRGLSVILCEQDDLASHTSSASTKLIHGGLRYLEHGKIRLVHKALREREVLLRVAPHLVRPLRLVLVHEASMRPAWMLRAGLWLYDRMGGSSSLPSSRRVDLAAHPAGAALRPGLRTGFEFSDAWTDDARLVVTAAIDAAERGARIFTRTCIARARREGSTEGSGEGSGWLAEAKPQEGSAIRIRARALVNATGPWADRFLRDMCAIESQRRLRLVKGSHLVVRRALGHSYAYMLQAPDRRIAFVIPFEDRFTLIGTTDVEVQDEPGASRIEDSEIGYLCELANNYFRAPLGASDIAWTFSGVRPLIDDGAGPSELTRDYSLELHRERDCAPLLTVWGGKITTFRTLAEEAGDALVGSLGCGRSRWTRDAVLPGGDVPAVPGATGDGAAALEAFVAALSSQYRWLAPQVLRRMARAYGTRISAVLGSAKNAGDLGERIADGLYEAELEYLAAREWARSAQDALWRRSKLGLHLPEANRRRVADWFERRQK